MHMSSYSVYKYTYRIYLNKDICQVMNESCVTTIC